MLSNFYGGSVNQTKSKKSKPKAHQSENRGQPRQENPAVPPDGEITSDRPEFPCEFSILRDAIGDQCIVAGAMALFLPEQREDDLKCPPSNHTLPPWNQE